MGSRQRPRLADASLSVAREQIMAHGAAELVDGVTTYVSPDEERERIRTTLYRTGSDAVATTASAGNTWTDAQLEHFRSEGYLVLEGLVSPEAVQGAIDALGELAARRDDRVFYQEEPFYSSGGADERVEAANRVRVMRDYCQVDDRLGSIATDGRLHSLIDQLLGGDHVLIQDTALLKPPFHGAEKPWHQDSAYFAQSPMESVVGVWIALDEATVENGCMQIIPRSHLAGPVPHHHLRDCQIDDRRISVDDAVVVPLRPGGALFFSALLHHGTPPNRSSNRRRALQFHFARADCTLMDIEEHATFFDDGGRYAGCRLWELREGMVRAAPAG